MERLAAQIPKPRINLVLYAGVLAPNAKLRPEVVRYARPTPPPEPATPRPRPAPSARHGRSSCAPPSSSTCSPAPDAAAARATSPPSSRRRSGERPRKRCCSWLHEVRPIQTDACVGLLEGGARWPVIVLDAGAMVEVLLGSASGLRQRAPAEAQAMCAQLIGLEVASVLRKLALRTVIATRRAGEALQDFQRVQLTRYAHTPLSEGRVWAAHRLRPRRHLRTNASFASFAPSATQDLTVRRGRAARGSRGAGARAPFLDGSRGPWQCPRGGDLRRSAVEKSPG
jgi:predicted nucleic acid-binding protein